MIGSRWSNTEGYGYIALNGTLAYRFKAKSATESSTRFLACVGFRPGPHQGPGLRVSGNDRSWWRVQPVNATLLVVYRQVFQSPRSSWDVGLDARRSCLDAPESSRTDLFLWESTGAITRWCSRCCRAAKGCGDRRSRPARGWRR